MKSKQIKNELEQNKYINTLYSIVDKLEQRIATLEKVLASHAKCIGEMREENFIPIRKDQIESIEKELKNES
jgi:exonuclease VII small subunit